MDGVASSWKVQQKRAFVFTRRSNSKLCKYTMTKGKVWDKLLPYVLLANH